MKSERVRVLCVDDSPLMRKLLTGILESDPGIEVVGTAPDPLVAREKIKKLNPDVVTLDVEMPKMDGISFLEKLMRLRPTPVVMVSTLTEKGAQVSLRALELGAVDIVTKPRENLSTSMPSLAGELCAKVKAAARARVRPLSAAQRAGPVLSRPAGGLHACNLVAIASSTGGTEAVKEVLATFPSDAPPVVIAQHIPSMFSGPFAARLDQATSLTVTEARDGATLNPGCAYVAPGNRHLEVVRGASGYQARLHDGEKVNRHRPSCDVLFHSVAREVGAKAVGIILTGMGDDGARGLLALKEAGAATVAQDEASSVVWGMPGSAVRLGAARAVEPLERISEWVFERAMKGAA